MKSNDNDIQRTIKDHEKRISLLEATLNTHKKPIAPRKQNKNLTSQIILLRDKNYFVQPKIAEEVHVKLQQTYHCELNRVSVALLRLARRKQLRRATKMKDDKTYQAYVW
jgi:hypothetical protein